MTTVYVDFVSGSDSTGNGSYSLPYKSLNKATTGLTGGDEVRCAYTVQTALSGTLTFTNGSTTVNTSANLTGEVSAYDAIFHGAANEGWWVVNSVAADSITLKNPYWGTDGSGKTCYKVTPQNITADETVAVNGTSLSSKIKISGGWNLGTQTQVGYTAIRFYGYAIEMAYKDFYEIEKFFMRIDNHSYFNFPSSSYIHDLYLSGANPYFGYRNQIENIVCSGAQNLTIDGIWQGNYTPNEMGYGNNSLNNFYLYSSGGLELYGSHIYIKNGKIYNFAGEGLYFYATSNVYVENVDVDTSRSGVNDVGIEFDWTADEINLKNCSVKNCLGKAIVFYFDCKNNYFYDFEQSGNNSFLNDLTGFDVENHYRFPWAIFDSSTEDPYRIYKGLARVTSNTTDSRSGRGLKFTPVYDYFELQEKVGIYKVTSETGDITLGLYVKKDGDFNGTVELLVTQNNGFITRTAISPTTDYVEYTVVVDEADLVENEYLEMTVLVLGTAGNVFVDDFSAVQA